MAFCTALRLGSLFTPLNQVQPCQQRPKTLFISCSGNQDHCYRAAKVILNLVKQAIQYTTSTNRNATARSESCASVHLEWKYKLALKLMKRALQLCSPGRREWSAKHPSFRVFLRPGFASFRASPIGNRTTVDGPT